LLKPNGALFYNSKEACPFRIALEELGHLQSPTALITDISTAAAIANDTVKQRRSKAVDMRYYWGSETVFVKAISLWSGRKARKI
jgi:hypothetical protein